MSAISVLWLMSTMVRWSFSIIYFDRQVDLSYLLLMIFFHYFFVLLLFYFAMASPFYSFL